MAKANLHKVKTLCDLGVGGERGRIIFRGGCAATLSGTEYKDPQKVLKKWRKK